jgi:DNA-binding MarR family transcriptional regulator
MEKPATASGSRPNTPGTSNDRTSSQLELSALQKTPGFMIRILQLQIFERFYPFFAEVAMSPAEYAILLIVRDNASVTQSELAAVLRMQLPNLVKILSAMEKQGTIARKRSTRDKRAVELSLTVAGTKRTIEATGLGDQFNTETLAVLTKQERVAFLEMLGRLTASQPVAST